MCTPQSFAYNDTPRHKRYWANQTVLWQTQYVLVQLMLRCPCGVAAALLMTVPAGACCCRSSNCPKVHVNFSSRPLSPKRPRSWRMPLWLMNWPVGFMEIMEAPLMSSPTWWRISLDNSRNDLLSEKNELSMNLRARENRFASSYCRLFKTCRESWVVIWSSLASWSVGTSCWLGFALSGRVLEDARVYVEEFIKVASASTHFALLEESSLDLDHHERC